MGVRELLKDAGRAIASVADMTGRARAAGYRQTAEQPAVPAETRAAMDAAGMTTGSIFTPGEPLTPFRPVGTPPVLTPFPVGANLYMLPRSSTGVDFSTLRSISQVWDLARLCIEVREDEIRSLDWDIVAEDEDDGERYADELKAARKFFERPDGIWDFSSFVNKCAEDWLRYDALTIYRHRTRSGKLGALEAIDGTCYSDDTEVLTERGWKRFGDIDINTDRFATRNQQTKAFEWQKATYYHEADFDGEMVRFHSRSLDLLVSPNHRMVVSGLPRRLGGSRHREHGEVFVKAEDLEAGTTCRQGIPATSAWVGEERASFEIASQTVKSSWRGTPRDYTFDGDDFVAFMGMWLAEGCLGGESYVFVSQLEKSKGFGPFRALLAKMLGHEPAYDGRVWRFKNRALHDYLAQFGHARDKYVPDEIKNLSKRQLEIFWRYYLLGDGHIEPSGRQMIITSSCRMAGDLQEIAQKLGASASVSQRTTAQDLTFPDGHVVSAENCGPSYALRLRKTAYQQFRSERVPYRGKIRCVSVPNEVLYVRRNGKPAWCGNTVAPLIDDRGAQPHWPAPAYTQWAWGMPYAWMTDRDVIYQPHRPRPESRYGLPPLEWTQLLSNTDIRLQWYFLSYFTEGEVPEVFINAPPDVQDPKQVKALQDAYSAVMSGARAAHHKVKWIPPGASVHLAGKGTFDVAFSNLLNSKACAAFKVQPQEVGFTQNVNKSTGQVQSDVQYRRSVKPTVQYFQGIWNRILREDFGMPYARFRYLGIEEEEDQLVLAQTRAIYMANAVLSPDEVRAELGYDIDPDAPVGRMVVGRTALFFVDPKSQHAARAAGNLAQQAGIDPTATQSDPDDDDDDQAADDPALMTPGQVIVDPGVKPKPSAGAPPPGAAPAPPAKAARDDLRKWRDLAVSRAKAGKAQRAFVSDAIPSPIAQEIAAGLAKADGPAEIRSVFARLLGDGDPKAS